MSPSPARQREWEALVEGALVEEDGHNLLLCKVLQTPLREDAELPDGFLGGGHERAGHWRSRRLAPVQHRRAGLVEQLCSV